MKRRAPATARNRDPIADVLAAALPESGLVLEVASGTGEHALHFARRFAHLVWQPSDPDPVARASIAAWRADADMPNLMAPLALDAAAPDWPVSHADAIVCINMVHISPWSATQGLFAGAARLLSPGKGLVLYGPFLETEIITAPTNIAFDQGLRARNPEWGLRDLTEIDRLAMAQGFARERRVTMPANNLCLVYRKQH